MSSRVIYPLQRSGNLLFLRASVRGVGDSSLRIRLLLDTGASYTTIPLKMLEDLGYSANRASIQIPIMTAGGMNRAPRLIVTSFDCLGEHFTDFGVIGLDLPFSPLMSGLLGMDFLSRVGATIDIQKAEIAMTRSQ
ncbi:MAG: transcriptional regulator [Alkalinema sp. RL_2_19]|nr:transcriptional regulator [Alkalinema sp. RL_2_19]